MKFLYLSNARLPSPMAHGLQIIQNCEAFADQTTDGLPVEVTLCIPHAPRTATSAATSAATDDLWRFYGVKRNFEVRRLPCINLLHLATPDSLLYRLLFYLQYGSFSLIATLASLFTAADVVYSRDPLMVVLVGLTRWMRPGRRLVYEVHQSADGIFGRRLQRWALRLSDLAAAITGPLRDKLDGLQTGSRSPTPIIVAHDGIRRARFEHLPTRDDARQQPGIPPDAFIIGYVGRLKTLGMSKGLDTLIEAISQIDQTDTPSVTLIVVGGPEEMIDGYRAQWADCGLPEDHFRYMGQVSADHVPPYLAACDVLAMPLPYTEHFAHYASPIKLFEYMAAGASGAVMITTDFPAWADVIQHEQHALLFPASDTAAMAEAIQRLRDDPALRQRLSQAAAARVFKDYTWDARAAKILSALAAASE